MVVYTDFDDHAHLNIHHFTGLIVLQIYKGVEHITGLCLPTASLMIIPKCSQRSVNF